MNHVFGIQPQFFSANNKQLHYASINMENVLKELMM